MKKIEPRSNILTLSSGTNLIKLQFIINIIPRLCLLGKRYSISRPNKYIVIIFDKTPHSMLCQINASYGWKTTVDAQWIVCLRALLSLQHDLYESGQENREAFRLTTHTSRRHMAELLQIYSCVPLYLFKTFKFLKQPNVFGSQWCHLELNRISIAVTTRLDLIPINATCVTSTSQNRYGVSNLRQPHDLFHRLSGRLSERASYLCVIVHLRG